MSPTDLDLELAAKAAYEARRDRVFKAEAGEPWDWQDITPIERETWREVIKAALAAIEESEPRPYVPERELAAVTSPEAAHEAPTANGETPAAVPGVVPERPGWGANNTLFTKARADAACERLRARRVNRLPPNQEALRWLKAAKESPADRGTYLHLLSLANWGLEKGMRLNEDTRWGILHEDLDMQVGHLLGADQVLAYRWLLTNPNVPEMEEQVDTLLLALQEAENPMEAAEVVLETISSRMAAARN